MLGNRGKIWVGLCEREPAPLLRRRIEVDGLRDLRATRLAHSWAYGRADGFGIAVDQDSQGLRRIRQTGPRGSDTLQRPRSPGLALRADFPCNEKRHRHRATRAQAGDHREVT